MVGGQPCRAKREDEDMGRKDSWTNKEGKGREGKGML